MEIRRLNAGDAEKYRITRHEALRTNPEAFSSSYEDEMSYEVAEYRYRLERQSTYTFGALDQDRLVGIVTLVPEGKQKLKHRAPIFAMYVTPGVRGQGIGRFLMNTALKQAAELMQVEQVYLTVTASNEAAKKLYTSLGFKTYGVDRNAMRIEDTYFDDELMVLFL
ncbi:GNAT family N-acetyltransferase [Mesobacillus subterraneus]|uniref:GNAT family N-acetyltransferase n=1 Tax=Mesobacillus subterraneus TaxID=285983 RepID=A0A3R9EZD8_9BACI|nr:GNAT family N-acetyltransferase [Mesobacillus subterraneus]RSD26606.1 GNAT family N-acetyltransferase [Mesobacillus subterraneus]